MKIDILTAMHSAEHLLNSTMVDLFGCQRSFSAHINKKKSKCDYHFDRPLTPSEISEIERRVNTAITDDLQLTETFISLEDAENKYNLDRLPESAGDTVRIISIGEYDAVPCIGNHVARTGQIGRFQISTTSFEEGVLRIRYKLID